MGCCVLLLVLTRGLVAQRRMQPHGVVEIDDVVGDVGLRLGMVGVVALADPLHLLGVSSIPGRFTAAAQHVHDGLEHQPRRLRGSACSNCSFVLLIGVAHWLRYQRLYTFPELVYHFPRMACTLAIHYYCVATLATQDSSLIYG